ncbi:MAG: hypothetical protein J6I68_14285 [Butyrivibrio sp.]|uniref:hypothetical protein n=1 Tax=Butyrivibrio sp. TaxID=28121 RepID=UPI001B3FCB30|nr:hypothetical protein [Butyrivibrio sp.]MBP3784410.1 hypothetical protein [Butyrivibrio sp.]
MQFVTDQRIDKWVNEHAQQCKTKAFDGAQFTYAFTPTGIVEAQTVECLCCNKKLTVYID